MSEVTSPANNTSQEALPTVLSETTEANNTNAKEDVNPQPVLYDKTERQEFFFEFVEDGVSYRIGHAYAGVPDANLVLYDELRETALKSTKEQGVTESESATLAADLELWDRLCIAVMGYGDPGESLPGNWKELVDEQDKEDGIQTLLACEVVTKRVASHAAFKPWGARHAGQALGLRCYFSGEELITKHFPPSKINAEHYNEHKRITSTLRFRQGEKLGKGKMEVPPSLEAKAKLYDKMGIRFEGYVGEPPLHHKAAIVTHIFSRQQEVVEKNSNSSQTR